MDNNKENKNIENEKKEWNAPQINEIDSDKTESGGTAFYHNEDPTWAKLSSSS